MMIPATFNGMKGPEMMTLYRSVSNFAKAADETDIDSNPHWREVSVTLPNSDTSDNVAAGSGHDEVKITGDLSLDTGNKSEFSVTRTHDDQKGSYEKITFADDKNSTDIIVSEEICEKGSCQRSMMLLNKSNGTLTEIEY